MYILTLLIVDFFSWRALVMLTSCYKLTGCCLAAYIIVFGVYEIQYMVECTLIRGM